MYILYRHIWSKYFSIYINKEKQKNKQKTN